MISCDGDLGATSPAFSPQQAAVYSSLQAKLNALYEKEQYEIHERIMDFHSILKERHPNTQDYALYHLISFSTMTEYGGCFDFPEPDSVERFIDSEYRKAF
jgi:hypothetical protein